MDELKEYGLEVNAYDPWADEAEVLSGTGITLTKLLVQNRYDGIVLAVAHTDFLELGADVLRSNGKDEYVLYDLKHLLALDAAGILL